MLRTFYNIRRELGDVIAERNSRRLKGSIVVTATNTEKLRQLQDSGYISSAETPNGTLVDFGGSKSHSGITLTLILNPVALEYFEDIDALLAYRNEEPEVYYVYTFDRELTKTSDEIPVEIAKYRQMLDAKVFLRLAADLPEEDKVTFFAPEKLEIPFRCKASDLRELPEVPKLCAELAVNAPERDQRIVLFKRSLRDHLRMHPVEIRFSVFLQILNGIYDSYHRDFELWLGNTFADIKKSFEEKRLKFISDLNGILSSVQASILAVPIAAILVGDKYDPNNPLKNGLLAAAVAAVSAIALKLLHNQEHTLESTKAAIDAVKEDYNKKQPFGSREFTTRLDGVYQQEGKVRGLLKKFRTGIKIILAAVMVIWFVSFVIWIWPTRTAEKVPAPSVTPRISPPK